MRDNRTRSIQAEVSNISKQVYPQLVDKVAMVNAPSWLSGLLKVFRLILPKSTLESTTMNEEACGDSGCVACWQPNTTVQIVSVGGLYRLWLWFRLVVHAVTLTICG